MRLDFCARALYYPPLLYEAIVFSQPHYRLVFCFAPYAARFRLQVVADVTTGSASDNACP
ncbi:hypothetical protein LNQ82_10235 [Conchiformibius steedae DSM 2580]|uniref:Uncharacterized protein n=1 Tax=Conchiformibius steedae DSM 2580 TaxID=1121352 RepID=A0AAE9KYF4_9NEIS|nr:hypothetical protein [Conchiformibius steedae]QMT32917.1 hypothetical protein H3L98_07315 [Conchiformibius steedae]URD67537.1 hypothetical protein LNQ82_10235 [Conchiformibius steedae DSM 2580]